MIRRDEKRYVLFVAGFRWSHLFRTTAAVAWRSDSLAQVRGGRLAYKFFVKFVPFFRRAVFSEIETALAPARAVERRRRELRATFGGRRSVLRTRAPEGGLVAAALGRSSGLGA
jgi:hypothetical protein